jgi:hypothetical protein
VLDESPLDTGALARGALGSGHPRREGERRHLPARARAPRRPRPGDRPRRRTRAAAAAIDHARVPRGAPHVARRRSPPRPSGRAGRNPGRMARARVAPRLHRPQRQRRARQRSRRAGSPHGSRRGSAGVRSRGHAGQGDLPRSHEGRLPRRAGVPPRTRCAEPGALARRRRPRRAQRSAPYLQAQDAQGRPRDRLRVHGNGPERQST